MKEQRERLIELLDEAIANEMTPISNIADYLLNNGVIVPPCKVGDMIYTIEPRFYNYTKHEGVQRGIVEKCELTGNHRLSMWVKLEEGEPSTMYCYKSLSFGKTVFLTREEAERALKGGVENNETQP